MRAFFILTLYLLLSSSSFAQNQNISSGFVFDGEPFITVDPLNSQHMIVAWMGYVPGSAISIKTRVTLDGGQTWETTETIPHATPGFTSADPSIAYDNNGEVYVAYVDYNAATLTGAVYTTKSTAGGLGGWGAGVEAINASADGSQIPVDRPWISIDISGGTYDGSIYITTMNPNIFGPVPPPYNPYFVRSTDGGQSYDPWKYLDATGWLAGSIIAQPMPTPAVSAGGTFHAVYPSYKISQLVYPQYILVSSTDGGTSFTHQTVLTAQEVFNDSLAKKSYLLRANPADDNHLIFLYLGIQHGDGDVFLLESFDAGTNWTGPVRVNDDPIGNNRMQDLVWADFDADGDLVVTWRDRRNGTDSTYMTGAEIWGAVRWKDSADFSANFMLSDAIVAYDTILAESGNDFMCVKFVDDTLNAVWGDTRSGRLNIWFQRMSVGGPVAAIQLLSSEPLPYVEVYPNPATSLFIIEGLNLQEVTVYNSQGQVVAAYSSLNGAKNCTIDLEGLASGSYIMHITTNEGIVQKKIIKP